jgi:MarR family transcriptional regulator, lower aerobic nicotinate degradation pathway regulator
MTPRALPTSPAADDAYRLDDQVGYWLRRAHQRSTGHFNEVMAGFDVTPTQFAALARIDDLGEVSQNELGRLTAMDPATIYGVITRLAKRGFVHQRADETDGRLVRLSLTDTGRAAVRAMKAVAADVSARTLAPLSPADQRQLLTLLKRIG